MYEVLLSRLKYLKILLTLDLMLFFLFCVLFLSCDMGEFSHSFIECGYLAGVIVTAPIGWLIRSYIIDCSLLIRDVLRGDVKGMLFFVVNDSVELPISVAALLPLPLKGFWLMEPNEMFEDFKKMTDEELRFARNALGLYLVKRDGGWRRRPYIERYMLE